jgi:hypothetical protein
VVGVCEGQAAQKAQRLFKDLVPTLGFRPSKADVNCPVENEPGVDDEEWDWADPKVIAAGKNTLVVVVFQYSAEEAGDFARAKRENVVLGVLRDSRGHVIDHAIGKSESDYSPLQSVEELGDTVVVSERSIDDPCDGGDRHRFREYVREYKLSAKAKGQVSLKTSRRLAATGRCSDSEAQIFREAARKAQ